MSQISRPLVNRSSLADLTFPIPGCGVQLRVVETALKII